VVCLLKKRLIILLLVTVFLLSISGMAYAEPQLDWDKEKAEIEKEMVEAYRGGDFKKVDAV